MKTHTGSCHCGKITYTVEAEIEKGLACNCSHCARKGFLLSFVPSTALTLLSGEENLTEYRFNKKTIAHLFCKTCGVQCFAKSEMPDGTKMAAINLRTLTDIDIDTLPTEKYNGKDI